MSSTYPTTAFPGHDFGAAQCIDGTIGTASLWNFCMSNLNQPKPWLSVQLPC